MAAEWLLVLQAFLTNPNVAYVLLVLGLWAVVAAWAIPGTGFPEAAAVICLVLAALGLAQLPVSLIGLALVVVSMGLFLVDVKVQSVGLTLGATTALALGSLVLFRPGEGAIVSRWLVGGATLASVGLSGLVLSAGLRAQRLAVKTDPAAVVGAEGVVITDIDPVGTVQVASELWSAVADAAIPAGTSVRVVAVEGIRLRVTRLEPSRPEQEMPLA
jgi:membrane-bound serine protease (ClpP class)